MPEISNVWALLGLVVVLLHQILGQYLRDRQHLSNTTELDGIRAELTECRARWDIVSQRLDDTQRQLHAIRGLFRPGGEHRDA